MGKRYSMRTGRTKLRADQLKRLNELLKAGNGISTEQMKELVPEFYKDDPKKLDKQIFNDKTRK
jgi:hypothetical protein